LGKIERKSMDWIQPALVHTVLNVLIQQKGGTFLTSWGTISLSRSTLLPQLDV